MSLLEAFRAIGSLQSQKPARFTLWYRPPSEGPVTVGHLEFDSRMWSFWYDKEFKARGDLRPLEGFDELERVYRSSVLFPFFVVRIPDLDRRDVKRRLREEHISKPDPADLLRIFGRRVASSPAFELVPS